MSEAGRADAGHVWQAERGLPALNPEHFKVDERSTKDFVYQAVQFARLLTYFDRKNRPHQAPTNSEQDGPGAWEAFFCHDVTFLLAELGVVDAGKEFRASHAPDADLTELIEQNVRRLVRWYRRARALAATAESGSIENAFHLTFHETIENELIGAVPDSTLAPILELDAEFKTDAFSDHVDCPLEIVFSTLNRVTGRVTQRAEQYLALSLAEKTDHSPHTGLYLAFVSLLQKSQVDLNRLTERHLEFYYRKVLQLTPAQPRPDRAHLIFELAPGARHWTLPKGTELLCGSQYPADAVRFRTDTELLVDSARVTGFRALRVRRERRTAYSYQQRVLSVAQFPMADSVDGHSLPLPEPALGWAPFGPEFTSADVALMQPSAVEIGVAIASPILNLAGGHRSIALEIRFQESRRHTTAAAIEAYRERVAAVHEVPLSDRCFQACLSEAFVVLASTAQGFVPVDDLTVDASRCEDDVLVFRLRLPRSFPALEPWLGGLVPDPAEPEAESAINTSPMLKLVLNPSALVFAYTDFRDATIAAISIAVTVRSLQVLSLATESGPVDASKPFAPFGPVPLPGASLSIWAPELARQWLTSVRLNLAWQGLPPAPVDLAAYYAAYGMGIQNDDFRIRISRSNGDAWQPLGSDARPATLQSSDIPLFAVDEQSGGGLAAASSFLVTTPAETLAPTDPLSRHSHRAGLLQLELTGPDSGFGQQAYPTAVTEHALARAASSQGLLSGLRKLVPGAGAEEPMPAPNPPLLPLVTSLAVDYSASVTTDRVAQDELIELQRLTPFGQMRPADDRRLIDDFFDLDGVLLIGLKAVEAPQVISLLFQMTDATAARWTPSDGFARPRWTWGYLADDRWRALPEEMILADETNGLSTSGIVRLALPSDMACPGLSDTASHWLTVSVEGDVNRYGRIIDVTTQGVTATRDPSLSAHQVPSTLPAGSISRLAEPVPSIKAVRQPLATIGGRPAEDEQAFRTRVSERLNHKQRAIQAQDYAHMVLEAFPDIAEARAYSTTAGRVSVVVTARRQQAHKAQLPLVPLETRYRISKWLRRYTSPFVQQVIVHNPAYESVRVNVRIVAGTTATRALVRQVEAEIDGLIAPWLNDHRAPLPIGRGRLDVAGVASHLEQMDGVAAAMGLSMIQLYRPRDGADTSPLYRLKDTARTTGVGDREHRQRDRAVADATLRPATPWSVLVPAQQHAIVYLRARKGIGDLEVAADFVVPDPALRDAYLQGDKTIPLQPTRAGIGRLVIGRDFVVTTGADAAAPTSQAGLPPHPVDSVFMPNPGVGEHDY